MANKRYNAKQIVTLLRQIEVGIANGKTTPRACSEVEITVQTYYRLRASAPENGLPAQRVDATPSNRLIPPYFPSRIDPCCSTQLEPKQGSVPFESTLANEITLGYSYKEDFEQVLRRPIETADGHWDVPGLESSGPFLYLWSVSVEPVLLLDDLCYGSQVNAVISVMHLCDR